MLSINRNVSQTHIPPAPKHTQEHAHIHTQKETGA